MLFLDEPTTGLDPHARDELWETVRGLVADGVTVLLTTQYLDEADQLADEIAVIDHGKVIAHGTPDELKSQRRRPDAAGAPGRRAPTADGRRCWPQVAGDGRVRDRGRPGHRAGRRPGVLPKVVAHARRRRRAVAELALRMPSLDEVFLALTGHRAEDQRRRRTTEDAA